MIKFFIFKGVLEMLPKKKVLIYFIIIFFAVFTSLVYPVQEVQAILPVILGEYTLAVVAGLATAAGITLATDDAVKGFALSIWERASDTLKNAILTSVGGTVFVTAAIWQELKELIASTVDGEVSGEILTNQVSVDLVDGQTQTIYYDNEGSVQVIADAFSYGSSPGLVSLRIVPLSGSTYWTVSLTPVTSSSSATAKRLKFEVKYVTNTLYTTYTPDGEMSASFFVTAASEGLTVHYNGQQVYQDLEASTKLEKLNLGCSIGSTAVLQGEVLSSSSFSTTLVQGENWDKVSEYYDNPAWDLTNKEITVPITVTGVTAKTPADVIQGTTSVAPPDVDVVNETGWLANIYSKLSSLVSGITALPSAIVGAISDNIVGDMNIDISPLRNVFTGVTTKFPFSLPWDLQNAVNLFAGSGENIGPWAIAFPTPYGDVTFDVVIPQSFLDYLVYIRWALLIMFDVGLIYATGRLLGGTL